MTPFDYWRGWLLVGGIFLGLLWLVIFSAVRAAMR